MKDEVEIMVAFVLRVLPSAVGAIGTWALLSPVGFLEKAVTLAASVGIAVGCEYATRWAIAVWGAMEK